MSPGIKTILVELLTKTGSRIGTAKYWSEISHLVRKWEDTGPRDILVCGNLAMFRTALNTGGIDHTARTRMSVVPRDFRIDLAAIGSRVRVRRARDVGRAVQIAADLGVLVDEDADARSHRRG